MEELNREVQQTTPPVRRKRKRRPKWMRVLRKYWPPIRFGIICLLILVMLIGSVRMISGLIRDAFDDVDTTQQTDPVETDPPIEQIQADTEERIKQADFLAAGYDYEAAIALLQDSPYYEASAETLDARIAEYQEAESKLVSYPKMSEITHVFFHTLVVDEARYA